MKNNCPSLSLNFFAYANVSLPRFTNQQKRFGALVVVCLARKGEKSFYMINIWLYWERFKYYSYHLSRCTMVALHDVLRCCKNAPYDCHVFKGTLSRVIKHGDVGIEIVEKKRVNKISMSVRYYIVNK